MAKHDRSKLRWLTGLAKYQGLVLPIATMSLFLVILVPLPTSLMDLLLLVNIMLSAIVLLTVMYITRPLEFSSFPSLLLGMTLFRLVLNIATTRLILTDGDVHKQQKVHQRRRKRNENDQEQRHRRDGEHRPLILRQAGQPAQFGSVMLSH